MPALVTIPNNVNGLVRRSIFEKDEPSVYVRRERETEKNMSKCPRQFYLGSDTLNGVLSFMGFF